MRFEGQAAMELEFALDGIETTKSIRCRLRLPMPLAAQLRIEIRSELAFLDWSPMIEAILADVQKRRCRWQKFPRNFTMRWPKPWWPWQNESGRTRVVLSGGCFQNRYLTERTVRRLQAEGFQPYWHQRVPPNDGGIALGQVVAALAAKRNLN